MGNENVKEPTTFIPPKPIHQQYRFPYLEEIESVDRLNTILDEIDFEIHNKNKSPVAPLKVKKSVKKSQSKKKNKRKNKNKKYFCPIPRHYVLQNSHNYYQNLINVQYENKIYCKRRKKEIKKYPFIPKNNFIRNITATFKYVDELASGATGRVILAKNGNQDDKLYALKEIAKNKDNNNVLFRSEVTLLKQLNHKNIVQYHESYIDEYCFYIAVEYCCGGTLLDKIISIKQFNEKIAALYIHTILDAVEYMHSLNIVHRDLKANNIVFDNSGTDGVLKIIDFGNSLIVDDDTDCKHIVGSIHYLPPEITRNRNGDELKKGDIWSIGVISYIMLTGKIPFWGSDQHKILSNIKIGKYTLPNTLSAECKDFISNLLQMDINKRFTAKQALSHEWITSKASENDLGNELLKKLENFQYKNKLQRLLVNTVLNVSNKSDLKCLINTLEHLAKNNENCIIDENDIVESLLLGNYDENKINPKLRAKQFMETMKSLTAMDLISISNETDNVNNDELDELLAIATNEFEQDETEQIESITMGMKEAKTNENKETMMSVDRFKSIMANTTKKHEIDNILNQLNPNKNDYISLKDIENFNNLT